MTIIIVKALEGIVLFKKVILFTILYNMNCMTRNKQNGASHIQIHAKLKKEIKKSEKIASNNKELIKNNSPVIMYSSSYEGISEKIDQREVREINEKEKPSEL